MKLSSAAFLLSAAVAALPGASAATVSLRGILPENEILADFANCCDRTDCGSYGINTCENLEGDCGVCRWIASSEECQSNTANSNTCLSGGGNRNCSGFSNRNSCENRNCEWVGSSNSNGECRIPRVSFRCSDFDGNKNSCKNNGCSWNNSSGNCSLVCRDFDNNRNMCERSGYCDWYGNSANSSSGNCDIKSCSYFDNTSVSECENDTDFVCRWQNSNKRCNLDNSEEEEVKEE